MVGSTTAAPRRLAWLVALAVLLVAPSSWADPESRSAAAPRISTALPAVARTATARKARDGRVEKYRQEYLAKARAGQLGRGATPEKRAEERAIAHRAQALGEKLAKHGDDRPILVIIEGPDGAGKSSTMERLRPAFKGRKVVETHFGAPPPDAEKVHWSQRFMAKLPQKGQVALWDRSYYGRLVYDVREGIADKEQTKQNAKEIKAFEKLVGNKVKIVKIYLDVSSDRQAKTLAKREVAAPEKLFESDYLAYADRGLIRGLFERAIDRTQGAAEWHVVPADDRAKARMKILDILDKELTR